MNPVPNTPSNTPAAQTPKPTPIRRILSPIVSEEDDSVYLNFLETDPNGELHQQLEQLMLAANGRDKKQIAAQFDQELWDKTVANYQGQCDFCGS